MTYDPPRLKDGADTPRELNAALDALRRGSGDAARVARVGARLGPLLDAPPPTPPVQAGTLPPRIGLHTLKAVRLFVAGMAVGASVLWLTRWQRDPPASPPRAPGVVASAHEANVSPSTSAAAAHAERLTLPDVEGDNLAGSAPPPEGAHVMRSEPARVSAANAARGPRVVAVRRRVTPASQPRAAEAAGSVPTRIPDPDSALQARPSPPPQKAEEPAPPPHLPKSEIELLFEARTLRQSAPREALLLLDQHANRFTQGMLAPEREAMAIEILRALGRTREADERLARYRAQYPNSLHLPRLEKAR